MHISVTGLFFIQGEITAIILKMVNTLTLAVFQKLYGTKCLQTFYDYTLSRGPQVRVTLVTFNLYLRSQDKQT